MNGSRGVLLEKAVFMVALVTARTYLKSQEKPGYFTTWEQPKNQNILFSHFL